MFRTGAILSGCGTYRYSLTRDWPGLSTKEADERGRLTFCMLNPSTADDTVNDPTIRRCMGFAFLLGFSGIEVVNVFAYRATDPKELKKLTLEEAKGPNNSEHLFKTDRALIVAAWGANDLVNSQAIITHFKMSGVEVRSLGKTKSGAPRHPLYAPYETELVLV